MVWVCDVFISVVYFCCILGLVCMGFLVCCSFFWFCWVWVCLGWLGVLFVVYKGCWLWFFVVCMDWWVWIWLVWVCMGWFVCKLWRCY